MAVLKRNYKTILLKQDGSWIIIWLNRPNVKNAISDKMIDELLEVLGYIANDLSIGGVAIRGVNECFCSGADLKDFWEKVNKNSLNRKQIIEMSLKIAQLFMRIYTMPKVIIALVEGPALAGGLGIVCCSDFVIGTRSTKFALSEIRVGLSPAQIAPYVIERIGIQKAKILMLSAEPIDGAKAHKYGFIDYLAFDQQDLEIKFTSLKNTLKNCAPMATATTKEILFSHGQIEQPKRTAFLANKFADCMTSNESQEGLQAFLEKRKPKWAKL